MLYTLLSHDTFDEAVSLGRECFPLDKEELTQSYIRFLDP